MSKETFLYKVNVKDFDGINGNGFELAFESDFELDEREISNKVRSLVVTEYNKLAHEANYKPAYDKLMKLQGIKDIREIDSEIIEVKKAIFLECYSDELD